MYTVYTVHMATETKIEPLTASADELVLSQADGRPMYAQLVEQVTERVALGDWPPGTKLPSIREMAMALDISAITVKRTYLELERDGVIVTQQGRGSWVAEQQDARRLQLEELHKQIDRTVELALAAGWQIEELIEELTRRTSGKAGPKGPRGERG